LGWVAAVFELRHDQHEALGGIGMLLLERFEVPGNLVVLQGGIDQDLFCPGGRGS
jgi:hypothetical protein